MTVGSVPRAFYVKISRLDASACPLPGHVGQRSPRLHRFAAGPILPLGGYKRPCRPILRSAQTEVPEAHASGVAHCGTPPDSHRLAADDTGFAGVAGWCTKARDRLGRQSSAACGTSTAAAGPDKKELPALIYNWPSGCWPIRSPVCMVPVPDPTAGHRASLRSPGPCTSRSDQGGSQQSKTEANGEPSTAAWGDAESCRCKMQQALRDTANGQAMRKSRA